MKKTQKELYDFLNENKEEIKEPHYARIRQTCIAFWTIFPAWLVLLITNLFIKNSLALILFLLTNFAVIAFIYYLIGYNSAQNDNSKSLSILLEYLKEKKKNKEKK